MADTTTVETPATPEAAQAALDAEREAGIEQLRKAIEPQQETAPEPEVPSEPEPEPEPEAEPAEPASEPADEIPDDFYREARQYGITRSQVKTMGREQAESLIARFRPEPESEPEKSDAAPAPTPAAASAFKIENADSLDPDTRASIQRLHDHYAQQIASRDALLEKVAGRLDALEKGHGQVSQFFEQQQRQQQHDQVVNWLDQRFAELGDSWEPIFGKGKTLSLKKDSSESQNRTRVIEVLKGLSAGYAAANRPIPDSVFRAAVLGEFEDHDQTIRKREQATRTQRAQDGRFVSGEARSASSKSEPPPTPEQEREDWIRKLSKETGLPTGL